MSYGINKAILIGNLGSDPLATQSGQNGTVRTTFSLATSKSFKDSQGIKQDRVNWHQITLWGKLAEIGNKYLQKGDKIYLEGEILNQAYESNGVKKYSSTIVGRNLVMLATKRVVENGHEIATQNEAEAPF